METVIAQPSPFMETVQAVSRKQFSPFMETVIAQPSPFMETAQAEIETDDPKIT